MTRRELISTLLKAGITLPIIGNLTPINLFGGDDTFVLKSDLPPVEDRIIVMLRMFGGNDGLNTLVPYNDSLYYKFRKQDSDFDCSIHENQVIKNSKIDSFGFHHQCNDLSDLFSDDKLAIIQNVGYPDYDLSHFRSTDIWLSGSDSNIFELSGWLGRYLEKKYPNFLENVPEFPPAIEFGTSVSRILLGKYFPMGFAYLGENYVPNKNGKSDTVLTKSQIEQNYILNVQNQSHKFLKLLNEIEANKVENAEKYPEDNYVADYLAHTARLIKSGLKSNIYVINTLNMFDNHEYLLDFQAKGLKLVSKAVGAFQRDLDKLGIADRVITVLYSEFSRRVIPNGTGTDHGAAGPLFVVGKNIIGGVYGNDPNLADLDANGNVKYEIDFRQIYATLLNDWFDEPFELIYPDVIPKNFEKLFIIKKVNNLSDNDINIFPNPCDHNLTLLAKYRKINDIEIFDFRGARLRNYSILGLNSTKAQINTSSLNKGVYFLKINIMGNNLVKKFIVER
jgi:uncharacterized protein (DUF1501 family)